MSPLGLLPTSSNSKYRSIAALCILSLVCIAYAGPPDKDLAYVAATGGHANLISIQSGNFNSCKKPCKIMSPNLSITSQSTDEKTIVFQPGNYALNYPEFLITFGPGKLTIKCENTDGSACSSNDISGIASKWSLKANTLDSILVVQDMPLDNVDLSISEYGTVTVNGIKLKNAALSVPATKTTISSSSFSFTSAHTGPLITVLQNLITGSQTVPIDLALIGVIAPCMQGSTSTNCLGPLISIPSTSPTVSLSIWQSTFNGLPQIVSAPNNAAYNALFGQSSFKNLGFPSAASGGPLFQLSASSTWDQFNVTACTFNSSSTASIAEPLLLVPRRVALTGAVGPKIADIDFSTFYGVSVTSSSSSPSYLAVDNSQFIDSVLSAPKVAYMATYRSHFSTLLLDEEGARDGNLIVLGGPAVVPPPNNSPAAVFRETTFSYQSGSQTSNASLMDASAPQINFGNRHLVPDFYFDKSVSMSATRIDSVRFSAGDSNIRGNVQLGRRADCSSTTTACKLNMLPSTGSESQDLFWSFESNALVKSIEFLGLPNFQYVVTDPDVGGLRFQPITAMGTKYYLLPQNASVMWQPASGSKKRDSTLEEEALENEDIMHKRDAPVAGQQYSMMSIFPIGRTDARLAIPEGAIIRLTHKYSNSEVFQFQLDTAEPPYGGYTIGEELTFSAGPPASAGPVAPIFIPIMPPQAPPPLSPPPMEPIVQMPPSVSNGPVLDPSSPAPVASACTTPQPSPKESFECINGVWTATEDLSSDSVVVYGPTKVIGNLSATEVAFHGVKASIAVSGCITQLDQVTFVLSDSDVESLEKESQVDILSTNGCNPSDLAKSNLKLNIRKEKKSCKKVTAQISSNHAATITAKFHINDSECKLWWIILASVLGGLLLIAIVVLVIVFTTIPKARQCVRPYSDDPY